MILPALLAISAPLLVGFLLGIKSVRRIVDGSYLERPDDGLLFMSNAGAAWDNAKKLIEKGSGKGSEAHKAAGCRRHRRRSVPKILLDRL